MDFKNNHNSEKVHENLMDFFTFIYDRQEVWYNRFVKNEEFPWTDDEILKKYRFCNVYRELDKGTQYLKGKVHENDDFCLKKKILNIVGYRFFNRTGFFENHLNGYFHIDDFQFKKYEEELDKAKERESIFNSAYLVTQKYYDDSYRKSDKHVQVLFVLQDVAERLREGELATNLFDNSQTAKKSWKQLLDIYLIGPFLAYEIWTDLTYLKEFPFTDNDYANPGPGAEWGLKIIFDQEKLTNGDCEKLMGWLRDSQRKFFYQLNSEKGKDFREIWYENSETNTLNGNWLSLRNIEHSLCEFRKYKRLQNGEGRKRFYRHES